MQRKFTSVAILLFMLLLSSGSGVLAAALFCPHLQGDGHAMGNDHTCCRAKVKHAQIHGSAAHHEAMGDMEMEPAVADSEINLLGQPAASCTHCMGRTELPTKRVKAREPNQKRPGTDAPQRQTTPLAPMAASYAPPVAPMQGAPPGLSTRKHLLIGVLLI